VLHVVKCFVDFFSQSQSALDEESHAGDESTFWDTRNSLHLSRWTNLLYSITILISAWYAIWSLCRYCCSVVKIENKNRKNNKSCIIVPFRLYDCLSNDSKNVFETVGRIFHIAGGWSAWPKPLLLSARGVIRFLLERNISYRRSRCVDSLIRGDKYRRDTSLKQTARAKDRWRRGSETRKWDKRIGTRRRLAGNGGPTRFYPGIRWAP